MLVRITKPTGFRGSGHEFPHGAVVEVPEVLGASMIAAGEAVSVGAVAPPDVETEAPVLTAARNGAAKKWKRKG